MRILVVDDHEFIRRGIRSVLASEPAFTICGEASNGQDAIQKAGDLRPDVVTMDISMPRLNGLDATRAIKRLYPEVEILIVSQHDSSEMIRQAMILGARGYVVKSTISTDLLSAIANIRKDEPVIMGAKLANVNQGLDAREILQRSAAFEKALRESEERFRSATNSMAEGLYIVDCEGSVTYVNPATEAMVGWTLGELLEKKMHDVIHYKYPDGTPFPAADCPGLQVIQTGVGLRDHQDVFIRKDGSFFPVILSSSPLRIDGSMIGLVVCFRDDTKRRETEEALRRTTAQFQLISVPAYNRYDGRGGYSLQP